MTFYFFPFISISSMMIFDCTASSGLSGSFSKSNSLFVFSSSVISIDIYFFVTTYLLFAVIFGVFLAAVPILAAGFATMFTLFFNLSRFYFALEVGALCFYGLMLLKPRDEPAFSLIASFFSSNAFLKGETYSLDNEEFFEDNEFLDD